MPDLPLPEIRHLSVQIGFDMPYYCAAGH